MIFPTTLSEADQELHLKVLAKHKWEGWSKYEVISTDDFVQLVVLRPSPLAYLPGVLIFWVISAVALWFSNGRHLNLLSAQMCLVTLGLTCLPIRAWWNLRRLPREAVILNYRRISGMLESPAAQWSEPMDRITGLVMRVVLVGHRLRMDKMPITRECLYVITADQTTLLYGAIKGGLPKAVADFCTKSGIRLVAPGTNESGGILLYKTW